MNGYRAEMMGPGGQGGYRPPPWGGRGGGMMGRGWGGRPTPWGGGGGLAMHLQGKGPKDGGKGPKDGWPPWTPPWGGGGGGGQPPGPPTPWGGTGPNRRMVSQGAPWGGAIEGAPYLPWSDWGQSPWAGLPDKRAKEAMGWMNVMLPWQQAYQQAGQWGTEFDWRKQMDEWEQGFQQEQFGYQQEAEARALAAQKEMTNVETFGRRWKPSTRWM